MLAGRAQPKTAMLALFVAAIGLTPVIYARSMNSDFSFARLLLGWGGNPLPEREIQLPNGQWMDVYLPAQRGPGVLVVHGGSWARGSRRDFRALNGYLRQKGYFVASLDYRLAPAHPYPAALEDLDFAYDYLVEHAQDFRLDAKRMAWLGRSAGGHLALLEAYSRRPSRCVIGYYPPTDMQWSYEHPSNPRVLDSPAALRDFLGGPPNNRAAVYEEASPLQRAHPKCPPTLLLHGLPDDLVYPEQSRRLERRLAQLGVPCESLYLPWGHHGCDINLAGPSGQLCTLALERFLKDYL